MLPNNLPPEVWHLIFSHLALTDLNTVMLVSTDLARVASAGIQWRKVRLSRKKLSMLGLEEEMATIKMDRLHNINRIDIKDYVNDSLDLDEAQERVIFMNVLHYCISMEHVSELSMELSNLVNIGPNLLSECIFKLTSLNLRYCQVDKDDLIAILTKIPFTQNLKSIDLSSMDLSQVPPAMLKEAAKSLQQLHLNYSSLSIEQCMNLLTGAKHNPYITSLGLGELQNMKHLPGELMRNMIAPNMRCLELSGINLKSKQMECILLQISLIPTMAKLDLTRNVLKGVNKNILAEALSNVEELSLMQTELGTDQVDALLSKIVKRQRTKEINLYEVNLSCIEKSLLAEAVKTMELVVLSCTCLTYNQIIALLLTIRKGSKLKTLYLNQAQLGKVDTRLLSEAILTLDCVYLLNTGLARNTVTDLVSGALQSKKLKYMLSNGVRLANLHPSTFYVLNANLDKSQLSRLLPQFAKAGVRELKLNNTNFAEVDIQLLTRVVNHLTFLDLSFSKLKKDQLSGLLHTVHTSHHLKELDMTGVDLSSVDQSVLYKTVANVSKVSMEKNNLGKLTEISILRECLKSSKISYLSLQYLTMTSSNDNFSIHSNGLNFIEGTKLLETVKDNEKVKELRMSKGDMSKVDDKILFQTVSNLKTALFIGTQLTPGQLSNILFCAVMSPCLQSLNLSSSNLSEVSSQQLAEATANLQVLDLDSTQLTHEQWIAVLGTALVSPALMFLNMDHMLSQSYQPQVSHLLKQVKKKKGLFIKSGNFS